MRKKGLQFLVTLLLVIFILAACGKSVEEQIDNGISNAQTIFKEQPKEPNISVGQIEVFLPTGYTIEENGDQANYLLKKGNEEYILFVNSNETNESKLLYDLFKQNTTKDILEEVTVEAEGAFGFTAVVQSDEESFELIVNSGGVKVSTLTNDNNIDLKLVEMMQIARSVSL